MPKKPNKKLARSAAMQGDCDRAITLLAPLAATDAKAAASLMQLLAFRGQWADVARIGLPFVDKLDPFDTLNVYSDTVALVAWAGLSGGEVRATDLKSLVKKNSPNSDR